MNPWIEIGCVLAGVFIGFVMARLCNRRDEYLRAKAEYEQQKARVEAGLALAREQSERSL